MNKQVDLVWASPPCMYYTTARTTAKYNTKPAPTIDELDIRATCKRYGKHYVIENVANCDDLIDPVKLNGYGFNHAINMTRKIESNYDLPARYSPSPSPKYEQEGLKRYSCHNMQECKKKDLVFLKDAPSSLTIPELRSYIPPYYVNHVIDNCPGEINTALDLCCGAGGVGQVFKSRGIEHVGIDLFDKSDEYPGKFVHGDVRQASTVEMALSKLGL